jgi:putative transposase
MTTTKYQGKYRNESARLKNWNYASEGVYFITICTKDRIHYFGEIKDGKMICNDLGKQVFHEWHSTPHIRSDMNLDMTVFVVMPNHIHGIIMIRDNEYNGTARRRDAMHRDPNDPQNNPSNEFPQWQWSRSL